MSPSLKIHVRALLTSFVIVGLSAAAAYFGHLDYNQLLIGAALYIALCANARALL